MDLMCKGEIKIPEERVCSLLEIAHSLHISGLSSGEEIKETVKVTQLTTGNEGVPSISRIRLRSDLLAASGNNVEQGTVLPKGKTRVCDPSPQLQVSECEPCGSSVPLPSLLGEASSPFRFVSNKSDSLTEHEEHFEVDRLLDDPEDMNEVKPLVGVVEHSICEETETEYKKKKLGSTLCTVLTRPSFPPCENTATDSLSPAETSLPGEMDSYSVNEREENLEMDGSYNDPEDREEVKHFMDVVENCICEEAETELRTEILGTTPCDTMTEPAIPPCENLADNTRCPNEISLPSELDSYSVNGHEDNLEMDSLLYDPEEQKEVKSLVDIVEHSICEETKDCMGEEKPGNIHYCLIMPGENLATGTQSAAEISAPSEEDCCSVNEIKEDIEAEESSDNSGDCMAVEGALDGVLASVCKAGGERRLEDKGEMESSGGAVGRLGSTSSHAARLKTSLTTSPRQKETLSEGEYCECSVCNKRCSKTQFTHHMRSHKGEKSFQCIICEESFITRHELTIHVRTHTGKINFECSVCKKVCTSRRNLNTHMCTHTGERPFQCTICEKSYTSKPPLKIHLRTHSGEKPFPCSVCERRFTTGYNLTVHMRGHTGEKPFQCKVCDLRLQSKCSLRRHMSLHTEKRSFPCSVCKKSFTRLNYLTVHMRMHTGDCPFQCSVCEKSFVLKNHLTRHMRIHTGIKSFQCSLCGKCFSTKRDLNKHHMRNHMSEKPFQCTVCEKRFSVNDSLRTHIRSHSGEKPFPCSICDKSFSLKSTLKGHMRTHTGEKSFPCPVCEKRFSTSSILKAHVRTHTGETPFPCSICERSFSEKNSLKSHMRSHMREKPFPCAICKKKFSSNNYLKVHMRLHAGEKPFHCAVCEKVFSSKFCLKVHMRRHTGEKSFQCSVCEESFPFKRKLKKHMRSHME